MRFTAGRSSLPQATQGEAVGHPTPPGPLPCFPARPGPVSARTKVSPICSFHSHRINIWREGLQGSKDPSDTGRYWSQVHFSLRQSAGPLRS